MSVPVLTFFNNKGGVGKTSLVYHLSWMFAELGLRVVAVDLDAQANLTAAFLDEFELEELWDRNQDPNTIYRAIEPLTQVADLQDAVLVRESVDLHLIPGDVALASFEDTLSVEWPRSLGSENPHRPFRILSAFWEVSQRAAKQVQADIILVDVGPNLGAINRSALIASDYVAIPLGADLFSLQGLKNLGPTLRSWRADWGKRLEHWKKPAFELPQGRMRALGYLVQQHGVRLSRPVKAYDKWINRIPGVYHEYVLDDSTSALTPSEDPYCLATLKHYRSLIPMAQEARKPIFSLTPADGAIGSHAQAVVEARKDFESLARNLLEEMNEIKPTESVGYGCVVTLSDGRQKANKKEILSRLIDEGLTANIQSSYLVVFRTGTPELESAGPELHFVPLETLEEAQRWRSQAPSRLFDYVYGSRSAFERLSWG